MTSVAGVSGDPAVYYFGAAAGGVWKTTDGGVTWTPISDGQPFSAVGAIAVAPSNADVLYVGTGEACIRGNVVHGNGVYRSSDAGRSWVSVGLADTRHIGRIAVHPTNPNVALVAALGHAYGRNEERGIFRTTDGGRSWQKVLYINDRTGGIDVVFDPRGPNVLFAAMWEAYRTPYSLSSGGPGSGLYRSTDGGATWKRLAGGGLPDGLLGRIGVAVSPADSRRAYAVVEAERAGGLYRSDDGGDSWRLTSGSRELVQRAWYFGHVVPDPKNPDVVYVLNISLLKSTDGGATFTGFPQLHADHHALWVDPANPARLISGNDGGANISLNGGRTWTRSDNSQPTAQFYHVATDHRVPYFLYGAQQDFETIAIPSRVESPGITEADWYEVGGCEMGFVVPHPADPMIVYAGCTDGGLSRYDHRTRRTQSIDPWPETSMGAGAATQRYRFQWTSPTVASRHDPETLYHAGNVVFKSTDRGQSWSVISPDLTRDDESRQQPSGGPITRDNVGTEFYCTIFALAESPRAREVLWAGSDDGLVHVTRDGGRTWSTVTPVAMPEWSLISAIEPSPHDPAVAYLAVDRHKLDDVAPYVYRTGDYGASWTPIVGGLPADDFVHVVREDPLVRGLLFAGTDRGVFVSFDAGARWQPLSLNLPTVPVHDLAIEQDDLVVATHGRTFWILDDLTPLRDMARGAPSTHLFQPLPAYRIRAPLGRPRVNSGENRPFGALITYALAGEPNGEVTVSIVTPAGELVRMFSSRERPDLDPSPAAAPIDVLVRLPVKLGVNRFAWNLRYPGPRTVPGVRLFWHSPIYPPVGPLAAPGKYEVRLTTDGRTLTAALEIRADPRSDTPAFDLDEQVRFHREVSDRLSALTAAILRIADARGQLDALTARAQARHAALAAAAGDLRAKLGGVEGRLVERRPQSSGDHFHYPVKLDNKLSLLIGVVATAEGRPTQQAREVYADLTLRIDAELGAAAALLGAELDSVNHQARRAGLEPVRLSTR